MPWCDDCSKFWNPPQLAAGGRCPTCGRSLKPQAAAVGKQVATPLSAPEPGSASAEVRPVAARGREKTAPWHFKLLVVGVTIYMIYRIYWLAEWIPKHI